MKQSKANKHCCRIMLNRAYLNLHAMHARNPHMMRDVRLDQAIAIDHCRGDDACAENYDGEGERDPICSVVPSVPLGNGTFLCDCSLTDRASQNCSSTLYLSLVDLLRIRVQLYKCTSTCTRMSRRVHDYTSKLMYTSTVFMCT